MPSVNQNVVTSNIPSGWIQCKGQHLRIKDSNGNHTIWYPLAEVLQDPTDGLDSLNEGGLYVSHVADTVAWDAIGDKHNYIVLPDLRGEFIRGWDRDAETETTERGVDPGRNLGTAQVDKIKDHRHTNGAGSNASLDSDGGDTNGAPQSITGFISPTQTADGADETRPRNIAMIAIIKT